MSLFVGYWQYIKKLDLTDTIQRMYKALAQLPHVSQDFHIQDQVGFGHILTYNTPEAVHEKMPVFLSQEQLLFVAQGRIDNRPQLFKRLGIRLNDNYPDGKIILQSYLKWGKECVHELRGDWSFAVFDYKEQELFLARDPMGYTTIYYYQDDSGFYFSSSIKSLLALPHYKKQLNEEYFTRKLTLWKSHDTDVAHHTFYKDIYLLPVARTLLVKDKNAAIEKYWQPQNTTLRYYKNKQDYADEMLELFTAGVQARLRSYQPVASMLSGGLDSSTVSYIAADLLKLQNKPLTTFSHVPLFTDELMRDKKKELQVLDESPFILEAVAASGNIKPVLLNSNNKSVLQGAADFIEICDAPAHASANLYWLLDIYSTTAQKGWGTLLSGEGGNGSISFAGLYYLLQPTWSNLIKQPNRYLKTYIAKPVVKTLFPRYFNKRKRINNSLKNYVNGIFASTDILNKYNIIDHIIANNKDFQTPVKSITELKEVFINLYNTRSTFGAACGQHYGIELRDPCTDQEVMEYFFSIPNEAFFDEDYNNRMLVKRMMKGKIPDKVLFEKKPGLQSSDIVYRAKAQQQEITTAIETLKRSPIANHYIDIRKLSEAWQSYLTQPYTDPSQMQRVLKALHFALFLQMNFD